MGLYPIYLPVGLYMMYSSLVMVAIGVALCILSKVTNMEEGREVTRKEEVG